MSVRHQAIAALAVSVCCALLLLSRPLLVSYLDNKAFDLLVSFLTPHQATGRVTMVDIDELSLAKVGRWPWPPVTLARLIDRLANSSASVVALDIVFSGPEPNLAGDTTLAEALKRAHSVIGFNFVFDDARNNYAPCVGMPRPVSVSNLRLPLLPHASGVVCNIPLLAAQTTETGFLNSIRDRDGDVRRVPALITYKGASYPSLALAAMLAGSGSRSVLAPNGQPLKLSERGNLLLRYRGPSETLPHHSAEQVLDGTVPASAFANKIVVVGSSAARLEQSLEIPIDRSFRSFEIQATAIDNLLAGDYFYHPGWSLTLELAGIIAFAFCSAWLLNRFSMLLGLISVCLLVVVVWALSATLIAATGAFVSPVSTGFACLGSLVFRAGVVLLGARGSYSEMAIANRFITGALGAMTAVRDVETGQHVVRIQGYLRSLCQVVCGRHRFKSYLTPSMIDLLVQLAPIHDIGKVGVPDYILRKPGALTSEEFEYMKSHVTLGKRILQQARDHSGLQNELFFQTATDIVYSHHEWWNGAGYPLGLKHDDIPIPGRLLAVADVYDALISKRHYKTELLHAEAVERIRMGAGTHFDPEIVECFLSVQDDWRQMAEAHRDEPGIAASAQ